AVRLHEVPVVAVDIEHAMLAIDADPVGCGALGWDAADDGPAVLADDNDLVRYMTKASAIVAAVHALRGALRGGDVDMVGFPIIAVGLRDVLNRVHNRVGPRVDDGQAIALQRDIDHAVRPVVGHDV